jgi:hypothetical protein
MFDDAGALVTDVAKLATIAASYNIYPCSDNGGPIVGDTFTPTKVEK